MEKYLFLTRPFEPTEKVLLQDSKVSIYKMVEWLNDDTIIRIDLFETENGRNFNHLKTL